MPPPARPAALRLSSKPDAILSCQGGGDFDVQAGTELSAEQVVSVTQRTKTIEQPHSNGGDFDSDPGDSFDIVELQRQHHLGWKQHDSVFGGTGDWSGRYGGVARRSVDGQVCFLQRTTAGALGVSSDVTPGRSTLPAFFASRIHQPLRLQPHQQLKQPQQQQSGLRPQPLEQVTQITPWEVIPPVPQEHYLEPPQSIHWQQHQSWQQRLICAARAVPPQRSEGKVNTTPAAGAVLPARFAADDAASPPLQQQQPQRPQQLSASLVIKTLENHAAATLAVAEVDTLQTRVEAPLMSADALVVDQVAAAAAARKKAKSLFEAAAGEDPFRQISVSCRSVDADGDLFAELHESEDEQHGKYLKLLSSPNAASNLGALPSAPPTTMFDAASEPEEEPTLPRPLPSNTKFAFVTVAFGDGSRFALDAAVMGI